MRRSTIVAALAFTIVPALVAAQTAPAVPSAVSKGSKLISGSAQLSRSTSESGDGVTSMGVFPSVLFFVSDRFAAGGELSLSRTSSEGFSTNAWSLGPAVRYFLGATNPRLLPFVGASVDFGRTSTESGGSDFEANFFSAEGVAGFTRLLNDNVGLNVEAFVRSNKQESTPPAPLPSSESTITFFGVRFGVSAFIR